MKSTRKQRGKKIEKVTFPVSENLSQMPKNYRNFIDQLKKEIRQERLKAVLSANSAMIILYWKIGKAILGKQQQIMQRTVAQIPWCSNITLLDKLKDPKLRLWHAQKTIENGFGKDMLVFQIENQLHLRESNSTNNFAVALPPVHSDLANQSFKDPYIFDFIGNNDHIREKEFENNLLAHIQKFLLELGQGFAFVGRQVHLERVHQNVSGSIKEFG